MTPAGLHYEPYRYQGHDEWLLRIGSPKHRPILLIPPLFEEMNRTRALLVTVMRRLADLEHCCWLIDLPGTGESLRPLPDISWEDWRHAVAIAARQIGDTHGHKAALASVRGGCLIDDAADAICHWRLAPVDGASLTRDMVRAALGGGAEWAGYAPSPALRSSLLDSRPSGPTNLRTAVLQSSAGSADVKLDGPALWRRSEPGNSAPLAELMAADISSWVERCAA